MLIDWFTVAAQIVNFLILLGLLKYFLFDRIISAMDDREAGIRERFEKAQKEKAAAEQERSAYEEKQRALENSRDAEMEKAVEEAERRKDSILENARRESEALRQKWRESLKNEKSSFYREFQETVIREIRRSTEKALSDLADANLENQAVNLFIARFNALDENELPHGNGKPPHVKTGFEIPDEQKDKIQEAFSKRRPDYPNIEFETDSNLVFGVELTAGGKKLAWHLKEYTGALEKRIKQTLDGLTYESKSA